MKKPSKIQENGKYKEFMAYDFMEVNGLEPNQVTCFVQMHMLS